MSSWGRPLRLSLDKDLCLDSMLLRPEFIVAFVDLFFGRDVARTVVANPRDGATNGLSILIKEYFGWSFNFFFFHPSLFLLFLLD